MKLHPDIIDYIVQGRKHGLSEHEIRQHLIDTGWSLPVIRLHFLIADGKISWSKAGFNWKKLVSTFLVILIVVGVGGFIVYNGIRNAKKQNLISSAWENLANQSSQQGSAQVHLVYTDSGSQGVTTDKQINYRLIGNNLYLQVDNVWYSANLPLNLELQDYKFLGEDKQNKTYTFSVQIKPNSEQDILLARLDISELEVTVTSSGLLQNINLVSNAPSLNSFKQLADSQVKDETESIKRDQQRFQDIRTLRNALELYFNEYQGYPAELNNYPAGPVGKYIAALLKAPAPSGNCADDYNAYKYSPQGKPHRSNGVNVYGSYAITFCLGNDLNKLKAGIATATPSTITSSLTCPDPDEKKCFLFSPSQASRQLLLKQLQAISPSLDYSAHLELEAQISPDLSASPSSITIPENAQDISQLLRYNK